jgi:hypothetical protein
MPCGALASCAVFVLEGVTLSHGPILRSFSPWFIDRSNPLLTHFSYAQMLCQMLKLSPIARSIIWDTYRIIGARRRKNRENLKFAQT